MTSIDLNMSKVNKINDHVDGKKKHGVDNKENVDSNNSSDIDVLFGGDHSLVINDENIEITPLRLGEFPLMFKAVKSFASELYGDPDWVSLMVNYGDDLLDALAIASRRSRDWIDNLELDDAMMLASLIFEVNVDFFVQRVVPSINILTEKASKIDCKTVGEKLYKD